MFQMSAHIIHFNKWTEEENSGEWSCESKTLLINTRGYIRRCEVLGDDDEFYEDSLELFRKNNSKAIGHSDFVLEFYNNELKNEYVLGEFEYQHPEAYDLLSEQFGL